MPNREAISQTSSPTPGQVSLTLLFKHCFLVVLEHSPGPDLNLERRLVFWLLVQIRPRSYPDVNLNLGAGLAQELLYVQDSE